MSLSNKEFVAHKGNKCPHCRATELNSAVNLSQVNSECVTQEVLCLRCGTRFTSEFMLSSYKPEHTYNHAFSFAFTVKNCLAKNGEKVTADQVREAVYRRVRNLDDGELVDEAIELLDTEEEQEPGEI